MKNKAKLFYKLKEKDSFYLQSRKLLSFADYQSNDYFIGSASYNIAYYFDIMNRKFDSAFYYYNYSKKAFLKCKDTANAGRKLLNAGVIQTEMNDFFGAKETLTSAVYLLTKGKDTNFLAASYNQLGTCYKELNDFKNAKLLYNKAIALSTSNKNLLSYKNNLGIFYSDLGDFKKADSIITSIVPEAKSIASKRTYLRILHNHYYFQWKKNKLNVEQNLLSILNSRKRINDNKGIITSHIDIAEFYLNNLPQKAIKHLDTSVSLAKISGSPKRETKALEILMKIEPNNIIHKNRYIFLRDSLYQNELNAKHQFSYMIYQDQQEKERLLQLEAETAQQEAKLVQKENQRIMLFSFVGLFLIGGVWYYQSQKQRYKKEKQEEVRATEERISQDLHDGLSNDIYEVLTLLQKEHPPQKRQLLSKVNSLYQNARGITYTIRGISSGQNFKRVLQSLLNAFQNEGARILVRGLDTIPFEKFTVYNARTLYQVLREILVNAKKHSKASLIVLQFEQKGKKVSVRYSDNGMGCPADQKFGVGLNGAVSRIASLGSKFIFMPKAGHGLQIRFTIPF